MQYNIGKGSNFILGIVLLTHFLQFRIDLVYRTQRVGSSKTEIFCPAENRASGDPKEDFMRRPCIYLIWTARLAVPGAIPWNSRGLLVN